MKKTRFIISLLTLLLPLAWTACDGEAPSPRPSDTTVAVGADTSRAPDGLDTPPSEDSGDGHVHEFGIWRTYIKPSCTEAGKQVHTCACGEREYEPMEALGHTLSTDPAVAPTCTTNGHTEEVICTTCKEVLNRRQTLYRFHSGDLTYDRDETHHWFHCKTCNQTVKRAEHVMSADGTRCLVCQPAQPTAEGFVFEQSPSGAYAVLSAYQGTEAHVQIPAFHDGLPVVEIGSFSFYSNPHVVSVALPYTARYVGEKTFAECPSLQTVVLGDNVESLGNYCFQNSTALTHVVMSESLNEVGTMLFSECYNLRSIVIPESLKDIGYGMFVNCRRLSEVTFHDDILSVERAAFTGCLALATESDHAYYVGTPENPYLILSGVSDRTLDRYTIHPNTKFIAGGAFSSCENLTEMVIPDGVISIGWGGFQGCHALTTLTLGEGLRHIGGQAFEGCRALQSLVIPASVDSIQEEAFQNCYSLKTVTIHAKVIGTAMFEHCVGLSTIEFGEEVMAIGEKAFRGCHDLIALEIPNHITDIGTAAFMNCSSLTDLILGNGIEHIGVNSFQETAITEIRYRGTEEDWNRIRIDDLNYVLTLGTKHYGYTGE